MDQLNVNDTALLQRLYSRRVATGGAGTSCVTPEALLAVVTREGPEDERLATLEHVMSCATCHREYEWLSSVDQAAREVEGADAPVRLRPWWRGAPLALAASLVAVVGAGLLLSGVLRRNSDLERGGRGDIALLAPGPEASAGAPLAFAWHALPGAGRYVLEIQGPDGAIALADTTTDTTFTVADPSRALPGSAYRWWVREVTDGSEPRSSAFRELRLGGR